MSSFNAKNKDIWEFQVLQRVRYLLNEYGFQKVFSEKEAELMIKCVNKVGKGFPRIGKHFDLKSDYIDLLRITFVDTKTSKIIGEVEYCRPSWFYQNPPNLVENTLETLNKDSPGSSQYSN